MRSRNRYGLYIPAKHPGRFQREADEMNRRDPQEDKANFCTNHCPHPNGSCDNQPCPEYKARFGRRLG